MDPRTTSVFYGLRQKGKKSQTGSIYISTVFQVFSQLKKSLQSKETEPVPNQSHFGNLILRNEILKKSPVKAFNTKNAYVKHRIIE